MVRRLLLWSCVLLLLIPIRLSYRKTIAVGGALFLVALRYMRERRLRPPAREPIIVALPLEGIWEAVRSPADHVPSHGTHGLAQTWAFDFIAVDQAGRHADGPPLRWWGQRPLEAFYGWRRPIRAPAPGRVVRAVNRYRDHRSYDSVLGVVTFLLTGPFRTMRMTVDELLGNHVVLRIGERAYALFAHLCADSVAVAEGQEIAAGALIGLCGNSGNSTMPHLHFQLMDAPEPGSARGIEVRFRDYEERRPDGRWVYVSCGVPRRGVPVRSLS